ncbi:coiled-coil domain-containing protein [Mariniblastus fucicola]|uniref:Chromosome partition protein Smc n=1 Tax=Mariniblastus fucicola TaxID=980251 RepID=A0A5B9P8S4_9BACT|nr:hypothetical protein [Mariniblastus fucicola]QEG22764.1 Chromosome partition protein Smc [Mariniblastus fucicola]
MLRYLFAGLLLVAIVVGAYVGCGPRMAVAGKKMLDQIDGVLGKLNVQLEKVEQAHAKLTKETEAMREKRIGAQYKLERLQEQKKDLEENIASYKKDLGRLRDYMKEASESGTVTINDKEHSVETLEALAQSTLKKLKSAQTTLDTRIKTLTDAYSKSLAVLKSNVDVSKQQLKKLDDQIEEIKAKKSALDAMKEASTIAGTEASISDKFNDLTKDVDDLLTEVDVKIAVESEKVDERLAQSDSDVTLDEILGDDSSADDTISEIDAILGGN